MADEYKPESVPAAFRDRKGRIDAAVDEEPAPVQKPKMALPEPKPQAPATGLPKPGLLDRVKAMVVGK